MLADCLLPSRHNGNGDGEELGDCAGDGAEGEFCGGSGGGAVLEVERAHDGVPVEVGEVRGRDTDQRAWHARIEP